VTLNTIPIGRNIIMQLILFCINQYTNLEVPTFTNYKDIIGAKFKKKRLKWLLPRPYQKRFVTVG